jgi:hypothetical protein
LPFKCAEPGLGGSLYCLDDHNQVLSGEQLTANFETHQSVAVALNSIPFLEN